MRAFSLLLAVMVVVAPTPGMGVRSRGLAHASLDIRQHLSTKAPYAHRVRIPGAPSLAAVADPPGFQPKFLYLLARHGSRWPTAKRLRQMESLVPVFQASDSQRHPWTRAWRPPLADAPWLAGELHPTGEDEMAGLARRLRSRFPELSSGQYAPLRFPLISTQVPRTAQSASAFALGFFSRTEPLLAPPANSSSSSSASSSSSGDRWEPGAVSDSSGGGGCSGSGGGRLPQPVALKMLPKDRDPVLRFFEFCPGYRHHEAAAARWLAPWTHGHLQRLAPRLERRLGLRRGQLSACHVDALWQLCAFEAGVGAGGAAAGGPCGLFSNASEVELLEWLEDVRLWEIQGGGAAINYEVAAPLLSDIIEALESAAAGRGARGLQRARLHLAHCETLTPLATLMGLFAPAAAAEAMPELPENQWRLADALGLSVEQAEADVVAADSVADDLVAAAEAGAGALGAQHGERAPPSKRRRLQAEDGAQPQQKQRLHEARAAESINSFGSSSGGDGGSFSSGSLSGHKHGPGAAGCSYRGGGALHPSSLLPPEGWAPRFTADDSGRVWRGGRIAPLGGNLALVLYEPLGGGGGGSGTSRGRRLDDHRVMLVYNEQVIPVPGCGDEGDSADDSGGAAAPTCSLARFLQVMRARVSREQFDRHCGARRAPQGASAAAPQGGGGSRRVGGGASDPGEGERGVPQLRTADGLLLGLGGWQDEPAA